MVSIVVVGGGGVGFYCWDDVDNFAADMEKCGKWGFYDDTTQQAW